MHHTYIQAGIKDICAIQVLARRIWEEAYNAMLSKEQIDYMLEMMYSAKVITEELLNGIVWDIIFDNDRPCGYISYSFEEDNSVKLRKLYIGKNSRGKGIAEDSIHRVLQYARRNGKNFVYLTVNRTNKRAIRAYEKSGFTITASVVTDISNGFVMDDYIMKCFTKDA